ncbi:PREDICTED: uncharacterized protein LOC105001269 [Bison bison bison]|uniref:Uncharacterized protein LOC105001269 n=1 Tax=Bison bison bison TaxID=43346 RepID=A0A6P3IUF5_BISBB|nr:PREDICTED: uncharacterized protein LOC105001269 [Bison bison bison]
MLSSCNSLIGLLWRLRFLETQEACLTIRIPIRIHISISISISITISARSPAIHLQKCAHPSAMSLAHLIHAHLHWARRNALLGHHAHHASRSVHPSGSNSTRFHLDQETRPRLFHCPPISHGDRFHLP